MIEPMLKYSLLVHHQNMDRFLFKLQVLGLLDITEKATKAEDKEHNLYDFLGRIDEANATLKLIYGMSNRKEELEEKAKLHGMRLAYHRNLLFNSARLQPKGDSDSDDFHFSILALNAPDGYLSALEALYKIEDLQSELQRSDQIIKTYYKQLEEAKIWGNYSPRTLIRLKEVDEFEVLFFSISDKLFDKQWIEDYPIELISKVKGMAYFVAFKYGDSLENAAFLDEAMREDPPKYVFSNKKREIIIMEKRREDLILLLEDMYMYISSLEKQKIEYINQLNYVSTKGGATSMAEDHLWLVEGYIPKKLESELITFLDNEQVIYLRSEVKLSENTSEVPVLLSNNAFASLFEPITKLFSLPKYGEMDLTPFFAPFFMLFFGFCFGDAGYGVFLLLLTTILKFKLPVKAKPFLSLGQFFGISAIIFGMLSGTFFGIELVHVAALVRFKDFFLSSDNLMTLSLCLGFVQILFGMALSVVNITKLQGFKYAVSKLAWLILLISAVPIIGANALEYTLLPIILYGLYGLMGLSIFVAFFYNSPDSGVLMNFGTGFWNTYNVVTGMIGDLLSYIRLFALGLTGGILGSVFNTLAMDMSGDIPVVSTIAMLLILIFGHSLNIGLSLLSSLVHPLRLTFVEFYKNAGFEGGGKEYNPFKIKK